MPPMPRCDVTHRFWPIYQATELTYWIRPFNMSLNCTIKEVQVLFFCFFNNLCRIQQLAISCDVSKRGGQLLNLVNYDKAFLYLHMAEHWWFPFYPSYQCDDSIAWLKERTPSCRSKDLRCIRLWPNSARVAMRATTMRHCRSCVFGYLDCCRWPRCATFGAPPVAKWWLSGEPWFVPLKWNLTTNKLDSVVFGAGVSRQWNSPEATSPILQAAPREDVAQSHSARAPTRHLRVLLTGSR